MRPSSAMAAESARWAIIGWSAPSMRHSRPRDTTADTGAAPLAISAASALAAGRTSSAGSTCFTRPPSSASWAWNTRAVRTHSSAWLMPTMRGRNQLAAPSGAMPRPANTKPSLALSARMRTSIGSVIVRPDADGRAVDRPDDGLLGVEDAQHEHAAAVAPGERGGVAAQVAAGLVVERVPAGAEVGAGAEAAPGAGDDHGPHGVVVVGEIERRDHLVHHRAGEGVEALGPVERDDRGGAVDLVGDLRERRARHGVQGTRPGRPRTHPSTACGPGPHPVLARHRVLGRKLRAVSRTARRRRA